MQQVRTGITIPSRSNKLLLIGLPQCRNHSASFATFCARVAPQRGGINLEHGEPVGWAELFETDAEMAAYAVELGRAYGYDIRTA